jgi:hypothetical protein
MAARSRAIYYMKMISAVHLKNGGHPQPSILPRSLCETVIYQIHYYDNNIGGNGICCLDDLQDTIARAMNTPDELPDRQLPSEPRQRKRVFLDLCTRSLVQ